MQKLRPASFLRTVFQPPFHSDPEEIVQVTPGAQRGTGSAKRWPKVAEGGRRWPKVAEGGRRWPRVAERAAKPCCNEIIISLGVVCL